MPRGGKPHHVTFSSLPTRDQDDVTSLTSRGSVTRGRSVSYLLPRQATDYRRTAEDMRSPDRITRFASPRRPETRRSDTPPRVPQMYSTSFSAVVAQENEERSGERRSRHDMVPRSFVARLRDKYEPQQKEVAAPNGKQTPNGEPLSTSPPVQLTPNSPVLHTSPDLTPSTPDCTPLTPALSVCSAPPTTNGSRESVSTPASAPPTVLLSPSRSLLSRLRLRRPRPSDQSVESLDRVSDVSGTTVRTVDVGSVERRKLTPLQRFRNWRKSRSRSRSRPNSITLAPEAQARTEPEAFNKAELSAQPKEEHSNVVTQVEVSKLIESPKPDICPKSTRPADGVTETQGNTNQGVDSCRRASGTAPAVDAAAPPKPQRVFAHNKPLQPSDLPLLNGDGKESPAYLELACAAGGYSSYSRYSTQSSAQLSAQRPALSTRRGSAHLLAPTPYRRGEERGPGTLHTCSQCLTLVVQCSEHRSQGQQSSVQADSADARTSDMGVSLTRTCRGKGTLDASSPASPVNDANVQAEEHTVLRRTDSSKTTPSCETGRSVDSGNVTESHRSSVDSTSSTSVAESIVSVRPRQPLSNGKSETEERELKLDTNESCSVPNTNGNHVSVIERSVTEPDSAKVNSSSTVPRKCSPEPKGCSPTKSEVAAPKPTFNGSEKAGVHFLAVVEAETARLTEMCTTAERLAPPSEEGSGKVRAAIGKAQLLITKKFEQFKGLCNKNLTDAEDSPFTTTGEDLAGFWDMVLIQVEDVHAAFAEIDRLKSNNWQQPVQKENSNKSRQQTKRAPVKAKPSSAPNKTAAAGGSSVSRARSEARQRLAAAKRAARQRRASSESDDTFIVIT